ncbi:MAG: hypothetical protein B5M54_07480 [Candidatus Aminicenantes bacterium 4484_214]|nr:MAG: hypothetical protein B5M54_07480 [Candidatus Aminicenantes bacterium 4484_214]
MKRPTTRGDKLILSSPSTRLALFLVTTLFTLLFSLLLASCISQAKLSPAQIRQLNQVYQEASRLFYQGDYFSLQEAHTRFQSLLEQGYRSSSVQARLLETSALLTLREKELAIPHHKFLAQAKYFLAQFPTSPEWASLFQTIETLPLELKGFANDMPGRKINPKISQLVETKALTSSFWAYLYLHFFPYPQEEKNLKSQIEKTFGDSLLIKYKLTSSSSKSSEEIAQFLQAHSSFKEIYFFLGSQLLKQGRLSAAEKWLKLAHEIFPDSLNIIITLSQLHFRLEEFQECLALSNQAINLKPDFRDALLGKVMCLSYLARHEEAIATAWQLLELGYYYLGETNYWLAWNFHALNQLDDAWQHIEQAKKYLIGWNEVYSLAGKIALDQNNLSEAEKNFKEALKLNPADCPSAFSLGKVYSQGENWKISAIYYQQAGECYEHQKKALKQEINEIQSSDLDGSRKIRLIQKKKSQLARLHLAQGTSFYNSAAGYFNAGLLQEALKMADSASHYAQLKGKSNKLIMRIKEEIKD